MRNCHAAIGRNDNLAELAFVTNPVVLIGMSIAKLADGNGFETMSFDMPDDNLSVVPFTLLLAAITVLYAGGGEGVVAWSCTRFRELVRG